MYYDAPARRIGCLIPNSSVIGVEMTDMLSPTDNVDGVDMESNNVCSGALEEVEMEIGVLITAVGRERFGREYVLLLGPS